MRHQPGLFTSSFNSIWEGSFCNCSYTTQGNIQESTLSTHLADLLLRSSYRSAYGPKKQFLRMRLNPQPPLCIKVQRSGLLVSSCRQQSTVERGLTCFSGTFIFTVQNKVSLKIYMQNNSGEWSLEISGATLKTTKGNQIRQSAPIRPELVPASSSAFPRQLCTGARQLCWCSTAELIEDNFEIGSVSYVLAK